MALPFRSAEIGVDSAFGWGAAQSEWPGIGHIPFRLKTHPARFPATAGSQSPIPLRLLGALVAALALPLSVMAADAARQRPNLVFVFSDQQSSDMLGCYGNKDLMTPNFDRLAREGVRFNHCVSNSPVCTPYRGILLSGQHPLRTGAMQNDLQMLPGNGRYFGEVLRDAGYRTGYYGKWHLYGGDRVRPIPPGPYRYGFDHEFLSNNCTVAFNKEHAYYWDDNGQKQLYGDWEPYAQTRQALSFIDRHAGKPFALFLSWHPPHAWGDLGGYDAPEDCKALYDPAKITLRPTVRDTPQHRRMYQGYMAMISSLDRAFGWLMTKLDEKQLAQNTIVVFTSDHGDLLMSYDWPRAKSRPEHGSCRVPLLVRFPDRLKPRVSDLLIGTFDLMPTLLSMMNLPVPDTCQGHDLAKAIAEGRDDAVAFQPLFYIPNDWRGIYTRRYTYAFSVRRGGGGEDVESRQLYDRLYDRQQDPWEARNLYDAPEYAPLRERLHDQTLAWMKRFNDTGLTWEIILTRTVHEEAWSAVLLRGWSSTPKPGNRPPGWEGKLRGRPLDLLRDVDPQ